MASGNGDFASGGRLDPGALMEQVKVQIAVANAQELLQRMTDKCFGSALGSPGAPRQLRAEMRRDVHGPLYGCLEHRLEGLQLPAAEGESQHVMGAVGLLRSPTMDLAEGPILASQQGGLIRVGRILVRVAGNKMTNLWHRLLAVFVLCPGKV